MFSCFLNGLGSGTFFEAGQLGAFQNCENKYYSINNKANTDNKLKGGNIMPKNSNRLDRVNEELKKTISHVIDQELQNSKVTGMISVTKVKVTPDFRYAKVYVSMLNSKSESKTMEGLKESSGFIRSQIARTMNLRVTPELSFEIDDSAQYGARIDQILKEINHKED